MVETNLRERVRNPALPPLPIVPVTLPAPALVEIIGFAGAEAVLIDAEHGTIGPETMRSMLAHARSAGTAAVYRPCRFDPALCRQALDAGAAGVHVSHVDTPEEARAIVAACRYAPLGQREMSLGRAVDYDVARIPAYVRGANDSQLLVAMIESPRALDNLNAIAAVPGIDVLHVGTADLTHALGFELGDPNSKGPVRDAVRQVIAAAARNGIAAGIPADAPADVEFWAAEGIRYFEMDAPDYVLRQTYAARLQALRAILT